MYVPNIIILAVKFRKILERSALNKKYMKKEFNAIFLFTEVKVAEVVKVAEAVM